MSRLWDDIRRDVMRRIEEREPTVAFEDRVHIAEDVAREAVADVELFKPENVREARETCICDGGAYESKPHPFLVNAGCPVHRAPIQSDR